MTDTSDETDDVDSNLYWVNLSMKIAAPDAATAVQGFVEGIVQRGLRGFVYSVEDCGSREVIGVFDGFGDPIDPSEILASQEKVGDDQDELLALAQRLNDEDDEPATPAAP